MPKETIEIAAYHYPAIAAGRYKITAALENELSPAVEEFAFHVGGYEYHIPLHEMLATYPPKEGKGNYAGAFPHIQFRRSTLPWEYERYNGERIEANRAPYVFVVLLAENELGQGTGTIQVVNEKTTRLAGALEQDKYMEVLIFPDTYFHLLPDADAMKKLAHVRIQGHEEIEYLDLPQQTSILVANRMVMADVSYRAFVCAYVSYENETYRFITDYTQLKKNDVEYAVALHEWNFRSTSFDSYQINEKKLSGYPGLDFDAKHKHVHPIQGTVADVINYLDKNTVAQGVLNERVYKDLLSKLRMEPADAALLDLLRYDGKTLQGMLHELVISSFKASVGIDTTAYKAVSELIDIGKVPLPHQLKGGGKLVSWYQGPFVNRQYRFYFKEFMPHGTNNDVQSFRIGSYLPDHPDKLILFNKSTNMLDMTYAAAWQLGRLLIMNNNKVLQELRKWKSKLILNDLVEKQNRTTHLMQLQKDNAANELPLLLQEFIVNVLKFNNFPIYYLFPYKDYLPEENGKYFAIDNSWVLALLFGIFSAGPEFPVKDFTKLVLADQEIIKIFDYNKGYYGFVIHSQLIVYWPHVIVELRENEQSEKTLPYTYVTNLSDTVRIYMTETPFSNLKIYQKNENAFFGVAYDAKENAKGSILAFDKSASADFPINFLHQQPEVNFAIR